MEVVGCVVRLWISMKTVIKLRDFVTVEFKSDCFFLVPTSTVVGSSLDCGSVFSEDDWTVDVSM